MDDAARIPSKNVPGRPQELLEAMSEKDAQEVDPSGIPAGERGTSHDGAVRPDPAQHDDRGGTRLLTLGRSMPRPFTDLYSLDEDGGPREWCPTGRSWSPCPRARSGNSSSPMSWRSLPRRTRRRSPDWFPGTTTSPCQWSPTIGGCSADLHADPVHATGGGLNRWAHVRMRSPVVSW